MAVKQKFADCKLVCGYAPRLTLVRKAAKMAAKAGIMSGAERPSSIRLRLLEWWWEPSSKVIVGFVLAILVLLGLYAFGTVQVQWNIRGRYFGPDWECTNMGKGASICFRDVPPTLQKPQSDQK
jgi:hypothetical protein